MLQILQKHAGASNFEKVYFVRVSHHTSDGQFVERRDTVRVGHILTPARVLDALASSNRQTAITDLSVWVAIAVILVKCHSWVFSILITAASPGTCI